MTEPHPFNPDLLGDCSDCPLPAAHPCHVQPAEPEPLPEVAHDPIVGSLGEHGDATTLGEVRDWLRERVDDGAVCPACTQHAKVYRRKINGGAARGLVYLAVHHRDEWVHVPTAPDLARLGGEFARLRYWNLVIEEPEVRDDGGRTGWWKITETGIAFVHERVRLPKYARVYNGRLLGYDDTVKVGIGDVIGNAFRLDDLMRGL